MKLNSANINVMVKACRKASKTLIRDFGEVENLQVSLKGPGDFVTNCDKKIEKILIDELLKARPSYSILSEEIGEINNDDSFKWIIDPIDGTSNFFHGIPHFAMSVGLEHNKEIICGIIYDPIKDEMFAAEKGNGSYLNNKRIRVSKKKKLEDCLFATGGIISEKNKTDTDITIRRSGSAALDMAYVASGRFDGYFQKKLNLWDIAAGIIIIKEAGGIINEIDLNKNSNIKIIASNNSINEKLVKNLTNF